MYTYEYLSVNKEPISNRVQQYLVTFSTIYVLVTFMLRADRQSYNKQLCYVGASVW